MITPRDRVGLVGANGTGKSTLLKILAGTETLDYGSVSRAKGISAGYLPQDGLALSGRTVFAECMSVFAHLRRMEEEMEKRADRTHGRAPTMRPVSSSISSSMRRRCANTDMHSAKTVRPESARPSWGRYPALIPFARLTEP